MLLLALCCSRAALAAVSFDANKYYYIIEHTTGRYVSSSAANKEGSYGLLAASLLGEKFRFAETQGKWQITTKAGSSFGVSNSNGWNISNSETEWTIEETNESGVYTLYQTKNLSNSGSRGYLCYQTKADLPASYKNSLYVNFETADGSNTHHTKFRIVEALSSYDQPQFGGIVWTYNTSTSKFDASGKTSTATPGRESNKGPVYKFVNAGTVTTSVNPDADTSDGGGVWVVGGNTNVTTSMGRWAGSVLVATGATATVSYSKQLKGLEPDASATVWTDGVLTFSGRNSFSMNDGSNQRWFIGENGAIWTSFTSVDKGTHTWDLQIVVADQPELANQTRTERELTKKVMTWGADLSSNINSITVWYKDANGTYTQLGANAVSYDATGITVTYTGLGYGPVDRAYTLTDENGATYEGTYSASWYGNATATPTLVGAQGYTLSNVRFSNSGGTYSLTADITFPFPVSSAGVKNSTGIKSALGDGYFFHVGSGDNAGKLWCTKNTTEAMGTLNLETLKPYRWYIYPQFNANEGKFGFTLQSVSTGKFVPTSTSNGTTGPQLVDEPSAGTFYYVPSQGTSNGFCTALSVSAGGLFLSVNSSEQATQGVFFYDMQSNPNHIGSNLSFPEPPIANALVDAVFDPLKNAARIPVTPGATIISPNEIAEPADINAAIEAAQTLAATATGTNNKNLPKIDFTESAQGSILSDYNAMVAEHGALLSVDYTLKAKYGTICLPFNYAAPTSWKLCRCYASNGNVLTLEQENRNGRWGQNTPYIVEYTGKDVPTADAPKKYQFIGYGRNAGTGVQADGWLYGVLDESANVPSGSYILSKYNNVLGFYQVEGNNVKACPKYKCYLTVTSDEASPTRAFFFSGNGEVTGIEGIFGNTEQPVIYNSAGQRLNSLQKGVNIVNGHKVLVK